MSEASVDSTPEICPGNCSRRRILEDAANKYRHPSAVDIIDELAEAVNKTASLGCAAKMIVNRVTNVPEIICMDQPSAPTLELPSQALTSPESQV